MPLLDSFKTNSLYSHQTFNNQPIKIELGRFSNCLFKGIYGSLRRNPYLCSGNKLSTSLLHICVLQIHTYRHTNTFKQQDFQIFIMRDLPLETDSAGSKAEVEQDHWVKWVKETISIPGENRVSAPTNGFGKVQFKGATRRATAKVIYFTFLKCCT